MQLDLFVLEEQYNILEGDELQTCKVCQKEKPLHLFPKTITNKSGYDTRCKGCIRKQSKLRDELRKIHGHKKTDFCDCCGQRSHKSLVIDHCHETLRFRGWLCEQCNHGIGKLGDNLEGVKKAVEYLEKSNHSLPTASSESLMNSAYRINNSSSLKLRSSSFPVIP